MKVLFTVLCLYFQLGAASDFAQAENVDCGGTPILAWDADSSSSNNGQTNSLQGCQAICNSRPECAGFTHASGQCYWSRAPLQFFPAVNKTCVAITTIINPDGALPKCTRADEVLRLDLMYRDTYPDVKQQVMNYELSGVTSGCLWRTYSREQVKKCMKGKWLIINGGSNQHQYSETVWQFFNPCDNGGTFPCDISQWYWNNTMYQPIAGRWRLWSDMIFDANGTIISFVTNLDHDIPTANGNAPWLDDSAVDFFLNYTKTVAVPPGGFRITWVRTRWFPYVFPVLQMLRDKAWPGGPVPILHLSIGRWYGPAPFQTTLIPSQMLQAVRDIQSHYPDIKEVYIEDDPNTEPYIDGTVAQAGAPAIQYRARDLYTNTNRNYGSDFIAFGHRTNTLHTILQQRFWGMQCKEDDNQPIYYSRQLLPVLPCEANTYYAYNNWDTQIYDHCPHTNILFTASSGATAAPLQLPLQMNEFASSETADLDQEDNLPSVRNPDNGWDAGVSVICTLTLIFLFVLWYFPTLGFLAKYYCCPRCCGCHKRELKVIQRPAETVEEGYEEVDLTKKNVPRRDTNRRATQVLNALNSKPDYAGPNAKKRFMGGMEGYDFVDEGSQFQTSGLQQHSRKTVAANYLNKLNAGGARAPPPRSARFNPPPPPPPPPQVEMQSGDTSGGAVTPIQDPVKQKAPEKRRHLDAFGFARYCASVHIVCGHLFNKSPQPVPDWYTSDWGYTWVPWFMMLSGFILTYARLGSSKPDKLDPVWQFFLNRARSVYPLYLSSLFCAAALDSWIQSKPFRLGTWYQGFMSFFLLQAWDPSITESTYQSHCWFLSCILPYWLFHNYLYRFLKARHSYFLWAIVTFTSVWPWIFLIIIPGAMGNINWYQAHQEGRNETWVDTLTIMLKFHPVFYFPVYLFGMALAMLFIRQGDNLNWVLRHGAVLGYAGLFFVFIATPWMGTKPFNGIPASKLTCRLGVLAPLQGLSLVGLAIGQDPLARLFSWLPLQLGERLSFPQYVLQFIVYTLWARNTEIGYWALLVLMSLCGAIFIQEPLARPTKDRLRKLFALLAMILAPFVCLLLLIISGNALYTPPPGQLPDFVFYGDGAYDTKLYLTSKPWQALDGAYVDGQYAYTNPSFLTTTRQELRNMTYGNITNQTSVTVQDLWVTARRFRLDVVTVNAPVLATEDGQPIFRAPTCVWFDPLQGCQGFTTITAVDAADCQANCCGLSNCRAFQYLNAFNGTAATCNVQLANKPVNCTGDIPTNIGMTGVKTSPLIPFNASASTNATAFWHQINASATQTSTWHSDVVFGTLDQNTMTSLCPLEAVPAQANVGGTVGDWFPCTPYAIYSEINNTMFQLISTGPEDARMWLGPNGEFFVSFTSNIPQTAPANTTNGSLPANCPGASSTQFFTSSYPTDLQNKWISYAVNKQCPSFAVLNATLNATAAPTPEFQSTMAPATMYTLGTDLTIAQKNWIAFNYASTTLFIVSIDPFQVMSVDPASGQTTSVSSYRNVKISNTAIIQQVVFHGGSNAILIKSQPIPEWAVTWNTINVTMSPTPPPTPVPASPCATSFTNGSYAQSGSPMPADCILSGAALTCTGGYNGTGTIAGNAITFTDLFGYASLTGYWMTDSFGNCEIDFAQNMYWSYQPIPPIPRPPVPESSLSAQQQAQRKFYYLIRPDFYLAAFHTIDNNGRYRNYLMEFDTSPPFKILRLSKALPLLEYPIPQPGFLHGVTQKMAFLSSIAELENGNLAFGYGSSNYQARALVLSRTQYEGMFSDLIPGHP